MLRKLDLPAGLPVREGCLFKRRDVQRATGAQDLTAAARACARSLVDDAQARAAAIEAAAYARGCQAGLIQTFSVVHRYLCDVRDAREQVRATLHANLADALRPVFEDSDTILSVVQSVLQATDAPQGEAIEIFLPAVSARDKYRLHQSLSRIHPNIAVQIAPHPTQFAVRWGAAILKFDLPEMVDRTARQALDAAATDARFDPLFESAHAAALAQFRDTLLRAGHSDEAAPASPFPFDDRGPHAADFSDISDTPV